MGRPALQDRAAEQARARGIASRAPTLIAPADSPATVTRVRVAAERRDVVAHPLERRDLVEQAEVGRCVGQEANPSAPSR